MKKLYIMETCPFCHKVMNFMEEENIKYEKRDVSNYKNHNELIELGGVDQVPFLVDGNVKMYESDKIIEYLKQ